MAPRLFETQRLEEQQPCEPIADSATEGESGSNEVLAARATMARVVDSIQLVSSTVEGISTATRHQAGGAAQVHQVVSEIRLTSGSSLSRSLGTPSSL